MTGSKPAAASAPSRHRASAVSAPNSSLPGAGICCRDHFHPTIVGAIWHDHLHPTIVASIWHDHFHPTIVGSNWRDHFHPTIVAAIWHDHFHPTIVGAIWRDHFHPTIVGSNWHDHLHPTIVGSNWLCSVKRGGRTLVLALVIGILVLVGRREGSPERKSERERKGGDEPPRRRVGRLRTRAAAGRR